MTRPTPRTPDLFGERTHTLARYGIPVVLGLLYGFWAAANRRHGGPITGWNLLFGFVTALAFIVLCIAVATLAPRLDRELHSAVKSAFAGAAVGFLVNQTGASVLRSAAMGLVVGAAIFVVFFYRYYTREDAEGNRIR
jgi:Na+/proline symporter